MWSARKPTQGPVSVGVRRQKADRRPKALPEKPCCSRSTSTCGWNEKALEIAHFRTRGNEWEKWPLKAANTLPIDLKVFKCNHICPSVEQNLSLYHPFYQPKANKIQLSQQKPCKLSHASTKNPCGRCTAQAKPEKNSKRTRLQNCTFPMAQRAQPNHCKVVAHLVVLRVYTIIYI